MYMNNIKIVNENNIIFYEDENNNTKVEVRLIDQDVWLNTDAIVLFLMLIEVVLLGI